MFALLKEKTFGLFWWSNLVNVIGDHITLLAFPWIALQMTGDVGITATVLAIQGLPRAVLMLVGGGILDRTNPVIIIQVTNITRGILVAGLAALTYYDMATLTHVFLVAILFGISDAFYYPASISMVPAILQDEKRQAGNALIQVTNQLAVFVGPMVAGLIIAGQIDTTHVDASTTLSNYQDDRLGLSRAFLFDAMTFACASLLLFFVKTKPKSHEDETKSLMQQIIDGIKFVWSIPSMRLCFLGIGAIEFCYHAPIFVGLPALTKGRFTEGALIFGWMVSAYGIGGLLGGITAGMTRSPKAENIARYLFLCFALSSGSIAVIAVVESYVVAMILFFLGGFLDNYMWIHFMTWIQKVTPERMMGRVMSLLMFIAIGMLPIAYIIMGVLFKIDLIGTMFIAGSTMLILCIIAAFHPDGKRVEMT
ncbi:MFS transporter [Temperatibacter marinus]|uniref:MFS transporter n=1 Tax=Temperatibacter marinus TaxID=1456591 RepID=A0AA52EIE1_9PROT|nr:MFS transporter [Temperatibacter marinus]WND03079.1 MFS transporter [Temperatibacter marinus]